MKQCCRFLKGCKLFDVSPEGREWCYWGSWGIGWKTDKFLIESLWERCPIPKRRKISILRIKAEEEKMRSSCFDCQTKIASGEGKRVLRHDPEPYGEKVKVKVCDNCFVKNGGKK